MRRNGLVLGHVSLPLCRPVSALLRPALRTTAQGADCAILLSAAPVFGCDRDSHRERGSDADREPRQARLDECGLASAAWLAPPPGGSAPVAALMMRRRA